MRSALAAFLGLALAAAAPAGEQEIVRKPATVETSDGWSLQGFYVPAPVQPPKQAPTVILTHMLGRTKEDWEPLIPRLADAG